jgi:hypothetical protein
MVITDIQELLTEPVKRLHLKPNQEFQVVDLLHWQITLGEIIRIRLLRIMMGHTHIPLTAKVVMKHVLRILLSIGLSVVDNIGYLGN